jgi:hypothetical protein
MDQLHLASITNRFDHAADNWEKAGNAFLLFHHYSLWGRVTKIDADGLHEQKIPLIVQIVASIFAFASYFIAAPLIGYLLLKQSTTYQPALARAQLKEEEVTDKAIRHAASWLSPEELIEDDAWLESESASTTFMQALKDNPQKLQEVVRNCSPDKITFLAPLCPKENVLFFLNGLHKDEAKLIEAIDVILTLFGDPRNTRERQATCEEFLTLIKYRGSEALIAQRLEQHPPQPAILYALTRFSKLPQVACKAKELLGNENMARMELSEKELMDILGNRSEVQRRSINGLLHLPSEELVRCYPRVGNEPLQILIKFLQQHPERLQGIVTASASKEADLPTVLPLRMLSPIFASINQAKAFVDAAQGSDFKINEIIIGILNVFGDHGMKNYQDTYEYALRYIASQHGWERIQNAAQDRSLPLSVREPIRHFLERNARVA